MSEITQADVEKAIKECYWRKEVAEVSFCATNCIPCKKSNRFWGNVMHCESW